MNVDGTWINAKTFDGRDSDGGDQFNIAVYGLDGNRLALRTSIYSEDSALFGLAVLSGLDRFPEMQNAAYDALPGHQPD